MIGTATAFWNRLTSRIGPRLAGTEAMARAASWARAQLKEAGLVNVHREPFPMTAWVRGNRIRNKSSRRYHRILLLPGWAGRSPTKVGGIDAEIALFSTYDAFLAAPEGSLKGKIAVGGPPHMIRAQDGSGYGAANPDPPFRSVGKRLDAGRLLFTAVAGHGQIIVCPIPAR